MAGYPYIRRYGITDSQTALYNRSVTRTWARKLDTPFKLHYDTIKLKTLRVFFSFFTNNVCAM